MKNGTFTERFVEMFRTDTDQEDQFFDAEEEAKNGTPEEDVGEVDCYP